MAELFYGYELIVTGESSRPWKPGSENFVAIGRKGGCRYQIKLYSSAKGSNAKTMSPEECRKADAERDALLAMRTRISTALREANGTDQLFACAEEVFRSSVPLYTGVCEAVPFIEGAVRYADYRNNARWIHDAFRSAAEAVSRLHSVSVLHTDLKPDNMIFTVNAAGEAHTTLIDFDKACFMDNVPISVGGTINYQPPELIILSRTKDKEKKEQIVRMIGPHTDVFALGASFVEIITGAHPTVRFLAEQRKWEVTWNKAAVQPAYLKELLSFMLDPEPENRPTAEAVAESLRREKYVEHVSSVNLWPEHEAVLMLNPNRAREIRSITPETFNGEKGYTICFADGRIRRYSLSMMRSTAILVPREGAPAPVRSKPVQSADDSGLLPEDAAVYELDTEAMRGRGYVRLTHTEKGYMLVTGDGELVPYTLRTMAFYHIIKAKGGSKK